MMSSYSNNNRTSPTRTLPRVITLGNFVRPAFQGAAAKWRSRSCRDRGRTAWPRPVPAAGLIAIVGTACPPYLADASSVLLFERPQRVPCADCFGLPGDDAHSPWKWARLPAWRRLIQWRLAHTCRALPGQASRISRQRVEVTTTRKTTMTSCKRICRSVDRVRVHDHIPEAALEAAFSCVSRRPGQECCSHDPVFPAFRRPSTRARPCPANRRGG